MSDYDIIVIGAGSGGYVAAIRAAQLGARVAIVEKDKAGGTCLNRGCIPTKTMIASTRLIEDINRADHFGIDIQGYKVDFGKIIERKNNIVDELVQGIYFLLKKNKIDLIEGEASLLDNKVVKVVREGQSQEYKADNIIIATGSRPFTLPQFNYDGINVVSSKEALNFEDVPEKMVIIGAGYIGCEFASIYSALGCKVVLVELMKQILPGEDRSTAKRMERLFNAKGIQVLTDSSVELVEILDTMKEVSLREESGESIKELNNVLVHLKNGETIKTEKVLVAVGRVPVTDGLGLNELGINQDERGSIIVNNHLETNIPGVYAVGDVTGKVMLAHVASAQGIIAAENIMGKAKTMDYLSVPSVVFTNPELARTGISFDEARKQGYRVKKGRFPYRANGKAKAMGEETGMVTLIADEETGRILGGEVLGADASNLISEITLAVKNGLTAEELASTIHAHPTLTENIMEAAEDILGMSIHS
ncbi:MAG: dihydrolipoyl dehydrogenase [Halanaerobiales bacterium]